MFSQSILAQKLTSRHFFPCLNEKTCHCKTSPQTGVAPEREARGSALGVQSVPPSRNSTRGFQRGKRRKAETEKNRFAFPFGRLGSPRIRLRCPADVLAGKAAASPADRCTRCAFALSATGSAKARGHTEGPRRLFGYFLAGEKVSQPRHLNKVPLGCNLYLLGTDSHALLCTARKDMLSGKCAFLTH